MIRASDVDVASILGYGFPAHKGGVHFWGSQVFPGGLKQVPASLFRRLWPVLCPATGCASFALSS